MAFGDEHYSDGVQGDEPATIKKRRLYGACDMCRKKKIRCDSAVMPDSKCSNCIAFGLHCEHTPRQTKAQERERERDNYIRALEDRLRKLEQALRSYNHPQTELSNPAQNSNWSPGDSVHAFDTINNPSPDSLAQSSPPSDADTVDDDDYHELFSTGSLNDRLGNLSLDPLEQEFFGRSSPYMLMKHAADVKKELTGDESTFSGAIRKRPIYWGILPWEQNYVNTAFSVPYIYPEIDLVPKLIDLYFTEFNLYLPILHRPTFEDHVRHNLHLRDPAFGSCLLLVCAIASRYSDDPRVLLKEEVNAGTRLSSGWKYFRQVPLMPKHLISNVRVYDLQFYGLAVMYLHGTGVSHACWNLVGIGLRLALERGIHRRRKDERGPTLEHELSKRAFWCIVIMDTMSSSFSGRPFGLHDEDFDIEMPAECDDEYWKVDKSGYVSFHQPPGKPSFITGFIANIKLTRIIAYAARTLYSTKKSMTAGHLSSQEWEQQIVTKIDSSLNQWKDSLPDHLRWDPHCEDGRSFRQSSVLHAIYYQLQIQAHRPFLQKQSPLSLPSFVICSSAARSCSRLMEFQLKRNACFAPQIMMASFITGIVSFLNLLSGKRAGVAAAPERSLADLDTCLKLLQRMETRWHTAGRFWDVLHELATMQNGLQIITADTRLTTRKRPYQTPVSPAFQISLPTASASLSPSSGSNSPTFMDNFSNVESSAWVPVDRYATQRATQESASDFGSMEDKNFNFQEFGACYDSVSLSTTTDASAHGADDPVAMWFNAPTNFDVSDWETFISYMNGINQPASR